MQIFAEHGVKGVYEEGNYYIAECDTEFGELRAYLLSRLMQNPYCDLEKETEGFLNAFYEGIYFLPVFGSGKAKADASTDEFALANITRSEISWRYVKSSLMLGEFSSLSKRAAANKALYRDILAHDVKMFNESIQRDGTEADVLPLYEYSGAENWQKINSFAMNIYTVDWVIYGAALLTAAIIFILAIKNKKYIYCVHLPLFAACIEAAMWSRRAFLSWKNLPEYAFTVVLLVGSIAFASYAFARLVRSEKSGRISLTAVYTVVFTVLYEASLLVINNAIYRGKANNLAMSIAYALCSLFVLILFIRTLKVLKASSKNESKETAAVAEA